MWIQCTDCNTFSLCALFVRCMQTAYRYHGWLLNIFRWFNFTVYRSRHVTILSQTAHFRDPCPRLSNLYSISPVEVYGFNLCLHVNQQWFPRLRSAFASELGCNCIRHQWTTSSLTPRYIFVLFIYFWVGYFALLLLILLLLTAISMSPGGGGYFTCIKNMKLVTNKFKSGGATWEACSGNLEPWEPSQHLLTDKRKTRKSFVEVAGRRTFWKLTSSQQSGI